MNIGKVFKFRAKTGIDFDGTDTWDYVFVAARGYTEAVEILASYGCLEPTFIGERELVRW